MHIRESILLNMLTGFNSYDSTSSFSFLFSSHTEAESESVESESSPSDSIKIYCFFYDSHFIFFFGPFDSP